MFQVTIREMFWLCLVAALALGWIFDRRFETTGEQFTQTQLMEERLDQASELVAQLQVLVGSQSREATRQME